MKATAEGDQERLGDQPGGYQLPKSAEGVGDGGASERMTQGVAKDSR